MGRIMNGADGAAKPRPGKDNRPPYGMKLAVIVPLHIEL